MAISPLEEGVKRLPCGGRKAAPSACGGATGQGTVTAVSVPTFSGGGDRRGLAAN